MKKSYEKIALVSVSAAIAIALAIGIHNKSTNKIIAEFETVIPSAAVKNEITSLTETPESGFSESVAETVTEFDYTEDAIPKYNRQGEVGFTFSEAFKDAREKLGPGNVFIWNGTEYTTDVAEDVLTEVGTVDFAVEEAVESETDETDVIDDGPPEPLLGTTTLTGLTGGNQATNDDND